MDFMELAQKRYSVRKYSDKPVEKEKLDLLLKAAQLAPTGANLQPQRIYVLQSEDALAKLSKLSSCVFGAKTVLLFTYNTDEDWKNPLEEGVHAGVEDVSIVATHVMFEAEELGLATCWCNYFPNTQLEKEFGLPKNERSVLFMTLGYAADSAQPAPLHIKRKDLASVVRYL